VLNPKNEARVRKAQNCGCGLAHLSAFSRKYSRWHGEHQLTIRDYLRPSNLNVTNQSLQATSKTKRLPQGKLVDAILPTGSLSASKSTLVQ